MAKFLFDSDVIIEYFKGNFEAKNLVDQIKEREVPACSSLTLIEVKRGVKEEGKIIVDQFFESLVIFPVDKGVADKASEFSREWARKGKTIHLVDSCIAATCVLNDLTLVTYNKKDYPMKELRVL